MKTGLMAGTSGTTFSPNGITTRGQIVTILYRLAGSPDIEEEIWGLSLRRWTPRRITARRSIGRG